MIHVNFKTILVYSMAGIMALWSLAPFYWVVLSTLIPEVELYSTPPRWVPRNITLASFHRILVEGGGFRGGGGITATELIQRGLANSLIVAITSTLIMAVLASMLGYVFARCRFPGKNLFFLYILGTIVVPGWPVLIGLLAAFSRLGLLDTLMGLIIVSVAYRIPFDTWFMRGYLETIPRELDDAARIDGCSRLGALFRILLPASIPGLASVLVVSFLFSWNMFLAPLVLTFTLKAKPITVNISELIGQFYVHWDLMSAGAVIAIIPPILVVLLFQKYIVQGMVRGAIK
ncbi:multiple sugar transport system permease protein [Candidatus Hakubella thermalkaliphila]|uniref:Multiple sugar transport system permease protein n=1 Tax=Candidatus Hakubella thermalkaliphila TaxID=2754717 RepID=A0A6V8PJ99_9ACTN|nr:multiple sugar transport system permease protein [Candidatus Hakubella thermalkaliphila]